MPVGVLTTNYIDVWCNTATDTPHKIQVGDMIAAVAADCVAAESRKTQTVAAGAVVAAAGSEHQHR